MPTTDCSSASNSRPHIAVAAPGVDMLLPVARQRLSDDLGHVVLGGLGQRHRRAAAAARPRRSRPTDCATSCKDRAGSGAEGTRPAVRLWIGGLLYAARGVPQSWRASTRERANTRRAERLLAGMARRKGFEPLTPRFEVWCSIQLSYRRRVPMYEKNGAPEEIRTPDPQIRSLVLYPAELRALDAAAVQARTGGIANVSAIALASRQPAASRRATAAPSPGTERAAPPPPSARARPARLAARPRDRAREPDRPARSARRAAARYAAGERPRRMCSAASAAEPSAIASPSPVKGGICASRSPTRIGAGSSSRCRWPPAGQTTASGLSHSGSAPSSRSARCGERRVRWSRSAGQPGAEPRDQRRAASPGRDWRCRPRPVRGRHSRGRAARVRRGRASARCAPAPAANASSSRPASRRAHRRCRAGPICRWRARDCAAANGLAVVATQRSSPSPSRATLLHRDAAPDLRAACCARVAAAPRRAGSATATARGTAARRRPAAPAGIDRHALDRDRAERRGIDAEPPQHAPASRC